MADKLKTTATGVDWVFRGGCVFFVLFACLALWFGLEHERGKDFLNLGAVFLFTGGFCRALFGDVLRGTGVLAAAVAVALILALYTLQAVATGNWGV